MTTLTLYSSEIFHLFLECVSIPIFAFSRNTLLKVPKDYFGSGIPMLHINCIHHHHNSCIAFYFYSEKKKQRKIILLWCKLFLSFFQENLELLPPPMIFQKSQPPIKKGVFKLYHKVDFVTFQILFVCIWHFLFSRY